MPSAIRFAPLLLPQTRGSSVLSRVRSVLRARRVAAALAVGVLSGVLVVGPAPDAAADTFSSPSTGTHSVGGAILDQYRVLGGPAGKLGYPVTDELPTPRHGGRFNHFERGSIYWAPGSGAHELFGAIRGHWASRGWENGVLGFPVTDEFPVGHGGVAQNFWGGSVYWSAPTGAHSVVGAIRERWGALGFEQGYLGLPVSDEIPLRRGAFGLFQGGAVYWSPTTGAQAVRGAIAARWGQWGYENGPLGYPVTSEIPLGTGGALTHFQGGTISWHPTTGAHVVVGAIRDLWAGMGWEASPLGHPTSSEYSVPGGRRTDFQHGSITWTPQLGAAPDVTVSGWGSQYVNLNVGRAPMLAAITSGPTSHYFGVEARDANDEWAGLLANDVGTYSGTVGLNVGWSVTSPVTGFQVDADTSWSMRLMPLAWAPAFGRYQPMNGSGNTVLHYVGTPGTVRITGSGSGYFGVTAYTNSGRYLKLLSNAIAPTSGSWSLPQDVYLEVEADGPWTIDVV